MRIANNIMAMNTHRSYTTNNDRVAASAEKLSSGYRINKAGDDAAGLAISEKMRSQIRGLNMAVRNSQDAISLIQTAEGALQEVHSILQRMNELAVQSATGTNEEFDREQITKEFEQLKREINDISDQTTFNNMKLLDGSLSNEGVKRSAETTGVFMTIMEEAAPNTATSNPTPADVANGVAGYNDVYFEGGLDGVKVGDVFTLNNVKYEIVAPGGEPTTAGAYKVEYEAGVDAWADLVLNFQTAIDEATNPDGLSTSTFTVSAFSDGTNEGLTFTQTTAGEGDTFVYMTPSTFKSSSLEIDPAKLQSGDQIQITLVDADGNETVVSYLHNEGNTMQDIFTRFETELNGTPEVELKGNSIIFKEGEAKLDFTAQPTESFGTMRIQVGALENEQVSIEVKAMNTAGLDLDAAHIDNQDAAGEAITKVRDAVSKVSDQRALLGASQNRMDHKINNLKVSAENLQAAESRIRDVDIAQEMTEFTKANILSQAATAMLAQANSAPQNVLSLLQ